jgi:2-iminobutanoate/2-iminopropanoate deaminase
MSRPDLRHHSSGGVGTGGSYSHAVVDGDYAFLAGQLAVDAPGGEPSDIGTETRVVMGLLRQVLADLGLDLGDLVRTNVYLREIDDFAGMDAEYAAAFGASPLPARTCVQVGALIGSCRVEIDGIARRRPGTP